MVWSRLQSASGSTPGGQANVSATYGTNLSSGSKLIAFITVQSSSGSEQITSVKDTAGNSFTEIADAGYGVAPQMSVWVLDTPSGDVGTKPTVTADTGLDSGIGMVIQEVSGLLTGHTSAILDGSPGVDKIGSVNAGPATTGSYSSTASNEYLVAYYGDGGYDRTISTPVSGYTLDANSVNTTGNASCVIGYKNSGDTSESASFTMSGSANWCTILVAFQLAPAPAPFYPATQAIRAKLPQGRMPFLKGRAQGSPGSPVQNPPGSGPVFRQQVQAVQAKLPQRLPFLKGRTQSSPGAPVQNPPTSGPLFRQATRAIRAVLPGPFLKGSAQGSPGALVENPPPPPFNPISFSYGIPQFQWTVSPQRISISHLATYPVTVPVSVTKLGVPYNPTSDVVQFAFLAQATQTPQPSDWVTGSWASDPSNVLYPQSAVCVIGTGGTITLGVGRYMVYVRVYDSPEIPVSYCGYLTIY